MLEELYEAVVAEAEALVNRSRTQDPYLLMAMTPTKREDYPLLEIAAKLCPRVRLLPSLPGFPGQSVMYVLEEPGLCVPAFDRGDLRYVRAARACRARDIAPDWGDMEVLRIN